jgi:hypothetical protein
MTSNSRLHGLQAWNGSVAMHAWSWHKHTHSYYEPQSYINQKSTPARRQRNSSCFTYSRMRGSWKSRLCINHNNNNNNNKITNPKGTESVLIWRASITSQTTHYTFKWHSPTWISNWCQTVSSHRVVFTLHDAQYYNFSFVSTEEDTHDNQMCNELLLGIHDSLWEWGYFTVSKAIKMRNTVMWSTSHEWLKICTKLHT